MCPGLLKSHKYGPANIPFSAPDITAELSYGSGSYSRASDTTAKPGPDPALNSKKGFVYETRIDLKNTSLFIGKIFITFYHAYNISKFPSSALFYVIIQQ